MTSKHQVIELFFMLFNKEPDQTTLESMLRVFHSNHDSIDFLEKHLRNSENFKKLSKKLEIELEISELYYMLLNRKPDENGISFFRNQILEHKKSIDWIQKTIENSDEFKSKNASDAKNHNLLHT